MNLSSFSLSALEGMLRQKNPQMYNQYIQYKNSGMSPDAVLQELMRSGKITQADVQKAQQQLGNIGGNTGYTGKRF
jgi:membrane peptidoglycan carboxypeptidase